MDSSFFQEYKENPLIHVSRIPLMVEVEKMGMYRDPVGVGGRLSPARKQFMRLRQEIVDRGEKW